MATEEQPMLTAGAFLDAVDYEFSQKPPWLRFLAHLAVPDPSCEHTILNAVREVEALFKISQLWSFWDMVEPDAYRRESWEAGSRARPTGAVLHGLEFSHSLCGQWEMFAL
ncbi:hypothetical protein ACGFOU_05535 [Streptomyces sp. NPDC048595]|uniref:hypothetical protein n=1 Tax=Streptomyces sp. NPDC048595 TaxID=3365576 RepID=UPI003716E1F7